MTELAAPALQPRARPEAAEKGWPTPVQELLLRAALTRGEASLAAYREWRRRTDLDDIDPSSYRILPLLWKSMTDQGVQDAVLDRCRGVYRHTWSRVQTLLHHASPVISALQAAQIPVLLLKGGVLALAYYGSPGLRPMNDLDILVPTEQAAEARRLVEAAGWRVVVPVAPEILPFAHGLTYQDADGHDLDLHWHALDECCQRGADDEFWSHAEPLAGGLLQAKVLSPNDLLLHVCTHGRRWALVPATHWIADAVVILTRRGGDVDWERLTTVVAQRKLVLPLREALGYLARVLDAPVPAWVLERLDSIRPGLIERLEHRTRMRPIPEIQGFARHWYDYSRVAPWRPGWQRIGGFLDHLRVVWGVRRRWQVPFVALLRVTRRAWRRRRP